MSGSSGWVYESTVQRMCDTMKTPYVNFPYKAYPPLRFCSKEELLELWTSAYEKLDRYIWLLEEGTGELGGGEKYFLGQIEWLENYIDDIDYQWSRFPKTERELEEERLNLPPPEPRVYRPSLRGSLKK